MRTQMVFFVAFALALVSAVCAARLELVQDRRSIFVIYHEADAPSSIAMAAAARLAIVHERGQPVIYLGDNRASRSLTVAALPSGREIGVSS